MNWPKDITKEDIQTYLDLVYSSKDAPKHQELIGYGNRCIANDVETLLSFPQSVVKTIMKGIAKTPQTSNRGLLVWHSVGSGKTLTATCVMDSFWDSDKNIVFATSVEASNSNPPSNFHKLASKFLSRFKGMTIEDVEKEFKKRGVKFFTFATLAHYLLIANPLKRVKEERDIYRHKTFLKNAVIIIDEVHNIFKPLPNQRLENDAVRKFLTDYENPLTSDLKIVILTATPGDTPTDVINLLNMVRDKKDLPLTVPDSNNYAELTAFGKRIQGLISYFDMSKDYTRFPRVINSHVVNVPMKMKHFLKYGEAWKNEKDEFKDMNKLMSKNMTNNYWKHARRYSNMLYDMEGDMLLDEFSAKIPALLNIIADTPHEKHYVYSAFYENRGYGGHGVIAIGKSLKSMLGYEKISLEDAVKLSKSADGLRPAKRYFLAISSELSDDREVLKKFVNAFNAPWNSRGEYLHVMLASQGYNEGIDLKAVRHIHIFEPLLTYAADKQTIGRAARFCSHSDLNRDRGEWTVRVHRYMSDMPDIDMSQFNLNYLKDRIEYLTNWIKQLENRKNTIDFAIDKMKGDNSSRLSMKKQKLELTTKEAKKMIDELQKKYKEVEKNNVRGIEMIDQKIAKEAVERTRELLVLYNVMKKNAVDYRLFRDFHSKA
jgi:hypothetical protein